MIFPILRMIHEEFRTISLGEIAGKLNYNENYLSNLIKNKTGKTFKEIQTKERLERAKLLIENTYIPKQNKKQKEDALYV